MRWMLVALVMALGVGPAYAQLSTADIEALRRQGEAEGWTFEVGPSEATQVPLEQLCGAVEPANWREHAVFLDLQPRTDLPSAFDWRTETGLPPVRSQGSCGACWAFAALGAMESAIHIRDGWTVNLSEQWLISCTGAGTCTGGWHDDAFPYLVENGLTDPCGDSGAVFEVDFPYQASDIFPCECPYVHPYWLESWAYVGPATGIPTVEQIKQAIYDYGPVAVCVYANSAFQAYDGGIFNDCQDEWINHVIVLTGWDDSQGTNGVWYLRNHWGTGWGENGYMRIGYDCSRIGYAAALVNYSGSQQTLTFAYPNGAPGLVSPSEPTLFAVEVTEGTGTPVASTGMVYYRVDGGLWESAAMTPTGGSSYQASLPAAPCGSVVDWYVSADVLQSGTYLDPPDAPNSSYEAISASELTVVLDDAFETHEGWTVGAFDDDATGGVWVRVDPVGTYVNTDPVQPEDDHSTDPGTVAYVTGQHYGGTAGASDVDGGKTTLITPMFALGDATDAIFSYWRWYTNDKGANAQQDVFEVDLSTDYGVSWTPIEMVGPTGPEVSGGWYYHEFRLRDYADPTDGVQLRFVASDYGGGSLVEAVIDDFQLRALSCAQPHLVASDPADGWIDARQPIDPHTLAPQGWSTVVLTFDEPASTLSTADFVVTETCDAGACDGVPPLATDFFALGAEGLLVLDRPIDPRAWTRIAMATGRPDDRVRLGFLPGDASASGATNTTDILYLIDHVNVVLGGGTVDAHRSDIDRSGTVSLADILRLIDLINGSDPFDAYLGATLPSLPD